MVEFARKLDAFAAKATTVGRKNLHGALADLAGLIAEAFDSDAVKLDRQEARAIMDDARAAARLVDAAHILRTRVLGKNRTSQQEEFRLPRSRDFETLRRFLDEEVRPCIEVSPFVYIVWKQREEEYLYVGHSQNANGRNDTLNLADRGKLKGAMERGTLFTVLFPSPITGTIAKDVEASILEVLEEHSHFPRFNDKFERVPGALGTAHLEQIGDVLRSLADGFKPTVEAPTQVVR